MTSLQELTLSFKDTQADAANAGGGGANANHAGVPPGGAPRHLRQVQNQSRPHASVQG